MVNKHAAEPKKPIEFALFRTLITLQPFFIKISAIYPPKLRAITETMLGMMIRTKKDPDARSTPNSLSIIFGKKD